MNDNDRPYNDLIGDILKSSEDGGKVEHLEGAGKPLPKTYLSGDTLQHFERIAKDAGYKPDWLKQQHKIRDELLNIANRADHLEERELKKYVKEINQRIMKYNRICPPPFLKGKVFTDTIQEAYKVWQ